jgi:hypothetical protein
VITLSGSAGKLHCACNYFAHSTGSAIGDAQVEDEGIYVNGDRYVDIGYLFTSTGTPDESTFVFENMILESVGPRRNCPTGVCP